MDGPNVIHVWHVRARPLPELVGRPPLESEQELSGVVVPQETVIRRDTEHRLSEGRPQVTANEHSTDTRIAVEGPLLPDFTILLPRHPPVYSRRPVRGPPDPEAVLRAVRRQRYIEDLERRIQEVGADPNLMLVRGTLNSLIQELRRVGGPRHRLAPVISRPPVLPVQDLPVPENVRRANRLQYYIEELERRIHNLRAEPTLPPDRGTLDRLMHELRGARAVRDRQGPITSLRPAVPAFQGQPQNNRTYQPSTPIQNTVVGSEPRPGGRPEMRRFGVPGPETEGRLNSVDRLHRLANNNLQNYIRDIQSRSDILDVGAFHTTVDAFTSLFQGLTITRVNLAPTASLIASLGPARHVTQGLFRDIQQINASNPTIVTPQIHREAIRAVIEDPETDNSTTPNSISEESHGRGDRVVSEGPILDDTSSLYYTSGEENQPHTQQPISAAPLRSVPDHDATLDQTDPAAQRHPRSEDTTRAEATSLTAASYTEIGRAGSVHGVHVPHVQAGNAEITITTLQNPHSSTAALPSLPATTTQAIATASLITPHLEDTLNEELYTDPYP